MNTEQTPTKVVAHFGPRQAEQVAKDVEFMGKLLAWTTEAIAAGDLAEAARFMTTMERESASLAKRARAAHRRASKEA